MGECQFYIKSEHELPEITDDEDAMLAEAFDVQDRSLGVSIANETRKECFRS